MKKTLFVVAIVAVLVFAFAASAMAASYFPNRSSAFLGGLSTATQQDEIALAAGGTKAAYISWGVAQSNVTNMQGFNPNSVSGTATETAWLMLQGPHAGYSLTTIKCQVCHSAHKAVYTGTALTASSTGGCVSCHGAASTFGFETVAAGSVLDNRHGGAGACTSYLCHTESPHGAHVSEYPAAASALLSNYADAQLSAAIVSGQTDAVATTGDWAEFLIESPNDVYGLGVGTYSRISIDIFQPDFDLTAEAALTNPQTAADLALGRAVATGYTCANEGCHVNGSFNGMSSGSWYGEWEFYALDGVTKIDPATLTPGSLAADGIDLARRQPISGHALFSVLTTSTENPLGTAWNESALCVDCHDQQDARLSENSFPHSNTVWAANSTVGSTYSETIGGVAYTALYNSAAWFKLGEYAGATTVDTNARTISATAGRTFEPLTVAMDGACLKCHDNADGHLDGGVGDTF